MRDRITEACNAARLFWPVTNVRHTSHRFNSLGGDKFMHPYREQFSRGAVHWQVLLWVYKYDVRTSVCYLATMLHRWIPTDAICDALLLSVSSKD